MFQLRRCLMSNDTDGTGSELFANARAVRQNDPSLAVELFGNAVERRAQEVGNDVHAEMASLWLEYGDVLLELEEVRLMAERGDGGDVGDVSQKQDESSGACGADASGQHDPGEGSGREASETDGLTLPHLEGGRGSESPVTPVIPKERDDATNRDADDGDGEHEDDDLPEDLQLAWECLDLRPETATNLMLRAHCHGRLGDLLLMQCQLEEAVAERQTALELHRRVVSLGVAGPSIVQGGLVLLAQALSLAGRVEEAAQAASEAVEVHSSSATSSGGCGEQTDAHNRAELRDLSSELPSKMQTAGEEVLPDSLDERLKPEPLIMTTRKRPRENGAVAGGS